MAWIITKYAVTAALVVLISELAKRSDKLGGFIAALPLVYARHGHELMGCKSPVGEPTVLAFRAA
ncbi:hypothetical protein [Thiothrix subterranea]|uniref:Uncharacterized protein n=1 Tax=Thiothrix subterranea TaxID=2735563 RepID=A0AA51QVM9_9GAMM|nr:hypothetical protein [Thiothrix subterranea]MDQ5768618.1 hypothetical protein [Thiothrix subterranea]WML84938.1 hypothetical protein RCG00_00375 [Thiothrix subterranea]